jgi:hypothetical protein
VYGDLTVSAVGAPGEDAGSAVDAGEVDLFAYDDETSRIGGSQRLRQGSAGIPGVPQSGDRFGASLLMAQIEWPQNESIPAEQAFGAVIGAPGDVVTGQDNAGTVTLYKVDKPTVFQYSQDSAGVPGAAEAGDLFGASLAVSEPRYFGAALRSVAVGSPGEDVGSVTDAGSVTLFASVSTGLVPRTAFTQNTAQVAGAPEPGDRFGTSVAFRPGPSPTLAIGVPYEDVGSVRDAGLVQTITVASNAGPTTTDGITVGPAYTENSAGTPGTVAAGNRFGLALAGMAGVREDLWAVSSPYQRTGTVFLASTPATTTGPQTFRSWVPGQGGIPAVGSGRWGWSVSGLAAEA